jgi:hypothetical protein
VASDEEEPGRAQRLVNLLGDGRAIRRAAFEPGRQIDAGH